MNEYALATARSAVICAIREAEKPREWEFTPEDLFEMAVLDEYELTKEVK